MAVVSWQLWKTTSHFVCDVTWWHGYI